jgi:hypothetical protein
MRAFVLCTSFAASVLAGAAAIAQSDPASRAEMVAAMLVDAERQAATPSRGALATTLARFERLGVHAAPGSGDDAIAEWRTVAGDRQSRPYRGRLLGPAFRRGWIEPGQVMHVEQLFVSGQVATVSVATVPDAPLRLGVSGPGDAAMCREARRNCNWMPLFTQRYTITLTNTGDRRARFYLVVD